MPYNKTVDGKEINLSISTQLVLKYKFRKMKNKIFFLLAISLVFLTSCENDEWSFDNYDYQAVYFAYQYPVRTITLGDDIFDTSLDNAHKCKIMATIGGQYNNEKEVSIDVSIVNSLPAGLLFEQGGDDIIPMPSNYYNLLSDKIIIPKGQMAGGVEVQLTDAFFADPSALKKKYVIPLQMTKVVNADTILSGKSLVTNPRKGVSTDWSVAPKDFIFYAIKYINPWEAYYLRRGKDVIVGKNGNTALSKVNVRHKQYVEYDEVFKLNTLALNKTDLKLVFKDANGVNINCNLVLTFDANGNCVISDDSSDFTATGTGKFVKKGEKNSWGSKDRDALYLNYEIDLNDMHITTADTLVSRNRGTALETFSPVLK